jgi:hypothetical protein
VIALLCATACRETRDVFPPPASQPAPAAPAGEKPREKPEARVAEPPKPLPSASRIKNISIDPQPLCSEHAGRAGGDPVKNRWLREEAIQRGVYALAAELKPFEAEMIGTTIDYEAEMMVVVFHTTFRDYETVRTRLLDKLGPLQVALRPACHSREQIAEAEAGLSRRDFHPRAASVALSYNLDPAFAGFSVMVQESAPEVAEAVKQRFGPMVRVSMGSLNRR